MRKARVFVKDIFAGTLEELPEGSFQFDYASDYQGPPVSLTMPIAKASYVYKTFPPFFEGLLPEGVQLEALSRQCKLDRSDYFGQLLTVGQEVVGAVTVEEML
jgi:serine/threonine-protein kinase HipA